MKDVDWALETFGKVRAEVGKAIVGQKEIVQDVLVGLATNGHVLLEGMPGLGKTLLVKTLSQALSLRFSRIQFTPDLMPADVTGTNVLAMTDGGARSFEFRRGPVFANVILADEINRATPKTQSALLEAMQERSVTIGGVRHQLEEPFLVMATQNPIEQEGTYPLPEAQLDRFLFKLLVGEPTKDEMAQIVLLTGGAATASPEPVATGNDVVRLRQIVQSVPIAESVLDFGLGIVMATRTRGEGSTPLAQKYLRYGASPRGAQSMVAAAKVYALLDGRFAVSKEDLMRAARPALRHRIGLNFEAEADGMTPDTLLDQLLDAALKDDRDPIRV